MMFETKEMKILMVGVVIALVLSVGSFIYFESEMKRHETVINNQGQVLSQVVEFLKQAGAQANQPATPVPPTATTTK